MNAPDHRPTLVLLSGGLDSTTAATQAVREGRHVVALTIAYGQRHGRELESAAQVAASLGIEHRVADVAFFRELAWYSALTSEDRFDVPTGDVAGGAGNIPITYVPMRNTFFLSIGAALLESETLRLVEQAGVAPTRIEAAIFIAANAIDYSGYPDCRPEYYTALSETIRLGSKIGTQYEIPLRIETPLLHMSKADIVRHAVELSAPIELTWSCYEGGSEPCGACDSCLLRAKGFDEAGVNDPALRAGN